jgi:CheY-like chemotaxis protein
VIVNGIELLRRTDDRSVQGKILDSMERASSRGENLTRQLLAFARQQPIKPARINVNAVIDHFEPVLRRAIPSEATLLVQLAQRLPDILADTTQLEAAILNLVVNARDAIDGKGSMTLATDVFAAPPPGSALPAGAYVRVRLRDTGCGMPADVAARAVEPFFTTKAVGKGTGLGLSQVYGMTQQAGGDMLIWSEPGQGTEIAMLFPALAADPAPGAGAGAAASQLLEKVLIVDDQPDVLEMTADMFRSMGYEVLTAGDGNAAMELVRRHRDLVLLFSDVVMPGVNGIELANQAAAQIPGLKIMLASGYLSDSLQRQHAEALKFDIIGKPYRLADILKKLRSL